MGSSSTGRPHNLFIVSLIDIVFHFISGKSMRRPSPYMFHSQGIPKAKCVHCTNTIGYYTSVRPFIFLQFQRTQNPPFPPPITFLQWSVSFTLWIWTWFNQEFAFQSSPVEGRKCVGVYGCRSDMDDGQCRSIQPAVYTRVFTLDGTNGAHTHQGLMKAVQHPTARITNVYRQDRKVYSVSRLYGFLRGWGRLYISLSSLLA